MKLTKQEARYRRKIRLRKKIHGTPENPRLVVFRSNKYIYAQLIDDENGNVLAASSSLAFKEESKRLNDSHIILYPNASVSNIVGVSFSMYMPDIVLDWCQDTVFIVSVPDSLQTLMSKGDKIIAVNDIPIDILIREKWNLIPASTKQAKFEALVRNQLLSCFNKDSIFNIKIENRKRKKITICPNLIKRITNLDKDNNSL